MARFLIILFILSGLFGTASAQPAHKVVPITDKNARNPAETSVAINPTNPDHIVAVSLQMGARFAPISNHAYVSTDGGLTWKTAPTPNPDNRTQGDDAVAFGPDGTAFHTYIAFQGIREKRPKRAVNGIFCSSSKDGLKWNTPVPVIDHVNTVEPFEDKCYLGIDMSPTSKHKGNIYVCWTKFEVYGSKKPEDKSHMFMSRSTDGGKSFSPAFKISDRPGTAVDDSTTVEGVVPAVGPNGEVYMVWGSAEGLVFDRSTDGGFTFGKDKIITRTAGGWDFPVKGIDRHNGMPVTGTDISNGPHRGSIYVSWLDQRNKDPDVFLIHSRDGGQTWSEPVRVNDDPKGNGKEQLFQWMAVDSVDGSVNLIFYDRRDYVGTLTGLTLARSVDGGQTFVNYKVDQKPFKAEGGAFFGDYIGIAAHNGRVVAVYPHFVGNGELSLSAAMFRFQPGTQKAGEWK